MKNTLTNNTVNARYFVVEPEATKVTEITAPLEKEDWNCVLLKKDTHKGQVDVIIYLPLMKGGPRNPKCTRRHLSHTFCETIGLANAVESVCKVELPHQIKKAISHTGIKEEYFFWSPDASRKGRSFRHISVKECISRELSRLQLW